MELSAGYKNTEVGIIPEDWEVKRISEISPLQRGFDLPNRDLQRGDYPVVYSNGIMNHHNKFQVKAPGIVTGRSGTIGKINYIEEDFWPHNTTLWVTDFNNNYPKYIYYLLHKIKIERFATGSGVPTLNRNYVHDFRVALPCLTEQIAVANALSETDALINNLEKLIAKKRNIKQGAMQMLLTPRKTWEVKKLGEIADITKLAGFEYSNYFNSYNDGGEIIVVRGINITHNRMDLTDVKYIPRTTSNFLQRSKLKKNDLVFAYVGTIGPIFLIDENDKYHLGPNTSKITSRSELYPLFLFHYFTSELIKKEIIDNTSIGAQPSLSMSKIRSFKIILPPLTEQISIATILSDMDKEITALEAKLEKYRKVKLGMMQNLLTGKIRLI
ncbi:restriction endonuclease subunit S [Emticicia soli]|uniref:Restriction endonuclease subunit S n=1 Tax=Emticicia soli TaxID=2027878 RepID=A0ABW5J2Z3_9BACT